MSKVILYTHLDYNFNLFPCSTCNLISDFFIFSSITEFHPKLIGLTGSPEEIKKTARAYRIYYMKTSEEDSDYLVDHSIIT
jgi:hypothetical protein